VFELFAGRTGRFVPKSLLENCDHIGQKPIGIWVADKLGRTGRQQDEGMAICLLCAINSALVIKAPDITAMPGISMTVPERSHSVIDQCIRSWLAHSMTNGMAMDHPGCIVKLPQSPAAASR
jgi:hypothetical protein